MTSIGKLREGWPLAAALLLATIWLPVLGRGFSEDDFFVVPTTWDAFLANPFSADMDGRPIDMLVFAVLPADAFVHHAVSVAVYVACIVAMWRLCRDNGLNNWSVFVALSSFFHPAFLWSVSWISQRNTLLVILFVLGALSTARTPIKLALIVVSSATKAPYFFQNVVFSAQYARRGQRVASVIPLLCMVVFGLAGYLTYYQNAISTNTLAHAEVPSVLSLPLRLAKLLEGVLYVFAPIPMFAVIWWAPIVALITYAGLWCVLIATSVRPRGQHARNGSFIGMAAAMCIPFVFASEVRVTGEAAVLTFLAVAAGAQWRRSGKIAAAGILALNLTGIALNYGAFQSREYDVTGPTVSRDTSQPAYAYQRAREDLRFRVLSAFGVNLPLRKVE